MKEVQAAQSSDKKQEEAIEKEVRKMRPTVFGSFLRALGRFYENRQKAQRAEAVKEVDRLLPNVRPKPRTACVT